MDTAQWPEQGIGVVKSSMEEKKQQVRPQRPQAINCPRCNSTHTKFCYYNNYSLTQPRYFCKTCRRYWTEGGSLRNVPVGGGSRKNKRSSSSSSPASSASSSSPASSASSKINKLILNPDHHHHMGPPPIPFPLDQNPNKINIHIDHQGQDLNLAYPHPNISDQFNTHDHHLLPPFNQENKTYPSNNSSSATISPQFSAMEFLKSTTGRISSSRGSSSSSSSSSSLMSSFISMPIPVSDSSNSNTMIFSSAGIPFQEFKPSLNFSLEGFGSSSSGYSIAGSSSCLQEAGVQERFGSSSSGYNIAGSSSCLQEAGVQESVTTNNINNASARLFFPPDQELKPTTNDDILEQNRGEDAPNGYWINGGLGGGSW